jgi:ectoine hydroxylase-related dioxygenase (phytanoyl-CoA dioxygenase family)
LTRLRVVPRLAGIQDGSGDDMRLTPEQVRQFKAFGFVVLKDFFDADELKLIRRDFDFAAARASKLEPFDGTKMQYFSMQGEETPFYASLPEMPRFYKVAEQLFGERTFAFESNAYRYVGNTRWHYNDGSSNFNGYGIKFQFALQHVDGSTGALRFIPGSHLPLYQDVLASVPPLGREWYDTDEAWEAIDKIPGHICEYGPGDAVAFDLRIFHATWGGGNDRQMSCVSFFHYPETPEEVETMRSIAPTYSKPGPSPSMPWNDGVRAQWLSNPQGSAKRQAWIDAIQELSNIPTDQTGLRLDFDRYGSSTLVPA